ncbi:carbohydrate kinase family protein [Candidatus Cloacimonadota bacterium]
MSAEKTFDVVVLGGAGIDTNIYLYTDEIDFDVEANFSENIDYIGQAGGYAARSYNKLGYKTAYIGFVGNDLQGEFIRTQFREDGIDISGLMIDPAGTKRSINFMYKDGKRKNFYDGKGSMILQPELALSNKILGKTKLAHVNIINWTRYLLPLLKRNGVIIASDIQDVVDIEDEYRYDYILNSDFVFFSAVNFPDPKPVIEGFLKINVDLKLICGRGSEGCVYADKDRILDFEAVELDKPVIDSNGAGDSLAAGFLSSYVMDGFNLEDSITRGQIAARYCCSLKASTEDLINKQLLNNIFLNTGNF